LNICRAWIQLLFTPDLLTPPAPPPPPSPASQGVPRVFYFSQLGRATILHADRQHKQPMLCHDVELHVDWSVDDGAIELSLARLTRMDGHASSCASCMQWCICRQSWKWKIGKIKLTVTIYCSCNMLNKCYI
jgi:hypothetical protein